MAKVISFNYEDKDYILEFSRSIVENMEKNGFDISQAENKPLSSITRLFYNSFKKNHPTVSDRKIAEIFEKFGGNGNMSLIEGLIEMYKETFDTLTDSEKVGEIKWEMKQ